MRDLREATVAIVGLGLMGGSLAAALSARQACRRVVGVARRRVTWEMARDLRFIDEGTSDLAAGLQDADVVVLALPVAEILATLGNIGRYVNLDCLVTDVGSTKGAICAALDRLPAGVEPLGGHPMCGKETSGLGVAEPGLFEGRVWVLCPLARTSPSALEQGRCLAQAVGARPVVLDPERHDHAVAAVSHLPYLLAVALVNAVGALARKEPATWELAASGLRDTSRLAGSDLTMMGDILATNRAAVLAALGTAREELAALETALRDAEPDDLLALLRAAHDRREEELR
ncbi:MAG: prephenate dehydrogenase/arogenate dehydrogenase family protein [Chloroflexi bacterium]|nr:prephenate dehydrogenase/arogenate dehydrogenase family protein [Chloroflexota bacterium]